MKKILFPSRNQKGQGMTEYMIIVGLIAIGALLIFVSMGNTIRGQFGKITAKLQGDSYTPNFTRVTTREAGHKTLRDYGNER